VTGKETVAGETAKACTPQAFLARTRALSLFATLAVIAHTTSTHSETSNSMLSNGNWALAKALQTLSGMLVVSKHFVV